jgi:hypothetical protein
MFLVPLNVVPFVCAIRTSKSNIAPFPMASMFNVNTARHGPRGPYRRSSSISPSDSPSQAQPPRRQSTIGVFAEHVDDPSQLVNDSAPDGRRKSLWGLDFMWKGRDREQSKFMAPVVQNQEDAGRRRSKFGSISNAIKKGLDKIRRRNDSIQDDTTVSTPTTPIGCGVGTQLLSGTTSRDDSQLRREEMRRYTADLEPFARNGMLRFHDMSQSQDDLLNSPSGPSTYYEDHRFEERGCSVHDSPYRARRKRGGSPDWVYETPSSPTPETNTEAGTDPYQWQMLSGHSPGPAPKRRGLSQYSVRQLPNFVRSSRCGNRMKRQSIAAATHAKPRGPRESHAHRLSPNPQSLPSPSRSLTSSGRCQISTSPSHSTTRLASCPPLTPHPSTPALTSLRLTTVLSVAAVPRRP